MCTITERAQPQSGRNAICKVSRRLYLGYRIIRKERRDGAGAFRCGRQRVWSGREAVRRSNIVLLCYQRETSEDKRAEMDHTLSKVFFFCPLSLTLVSTLSSLWGTLKRICWAVGYLDTCWHHWNKAHQLSSTLLIFLFVVFNKLHFITQQINTSFMLITV